MPWTGKSSSSPIPVTDVDRAKAFYVDQVGFNADHDYQVNENLRFVQLTPPGSACSIVHGHWYHRHAARLAARRAVVVADVAAARSRCSSTACGQRDRRSAVGLLCHLRRSGRQHLGASAAAAPAVAVSRRRDASRGGPCRTAAHVVKLRTS